MNFLIFLSFCCFCFAHMRFDHPVARSQDTNIKRPYPCGDSTFHAEGDAVTTLTPGMNRLKFTRTVRHNGAPLRIAISQNNDDGFDEHVLMAHIPHPDAATSVPYSFEIDVPIPDMDCERCSLQVISVMTDKIGDDCCSYPKQMDSWVVCRSVYHSCANIRITGSKSGGMPAFPTENTQIWAVGEGSRDAFTKLADGTMMFDQPFQPFMPEMCTCEGGECTRNTVTGQASIMPDKLFNMPNELMPGATNEPEAEKTEPVAEPETESSTDDDDDDTPSSSSSSESEPEVEIVPSTDSITTDSSSIQNTLSIILIIVAIII